MNRGKRKFTFMELLVVVAVIAILAGMLLPALNSARQKALTISCASNEKQIGQAFLFYQNDFSGYFPPWRDFNGSAARNTSRPWGVLFMNAGYLPNMKDGIKVRWNTPWFCPENLPRLHERLDANPTGQAWEIQKHSLSYAYAYASTSPGGGNDADSPPKRNSQLKNPSSTMLFAEADGNDGTPTSLMKAVATYPGNLGRHPVRGAAGNMGYADGHVAFVKNGIALLEQWKNASGRKKAPFGQDFK